MYGALKETAKIPEEEKKEEDEEEGDEKKTTKEREERQHRKISKRNEIHPMNECKSITWKRTYIEEKRKNKRKKKLILVHYTQN